MTTLTDLNRFEHFPTILRHIFVAKYNITRRWMISYLPDGRPPQPVRPWKSGRVHLAEGSDVVVLEQEIRSVELGVCPMQLFFIF